VPGVSFEGLQRQSKTCALQVTNLTLSIALRDVQRYSSKIKMIIIVSRTSAIILFCFDVKHLLGHNSMTDLFRS
jgi:hypothetical protein